MRTSRISATTIGIRCSSQSIFTSDIVWLVVLRIYVTLALFQPYCDLEAGDNQSLKFKWRGRESNPGPLAPQVKSLTTRPPPLQRYRLNNYFLLNEKETYSHVFFHFNVPGQIQVAGIRRESLQAR